VPSIPDDLSIVEHGLPRLPRRPLRVAVLGAGMAGLVATYELQRAGHEPLLIEARQRVGGRVETLRAPFAEGLHAEAGVMAIPATHRLTLGYVRAFGIPLKPFPISNPDAYYYVGGRRLRIREAEADPRSAGLAAGQSDESVSQLWKTTLAPLVRQIGRDGEAAWAELSRLYDRCSLREFLASHGWTEEGIELFGILLNQEALLDTSALELLREELSGCYVDTACIEGGMDRLPRAFLPHLAGALRLHTRVVAIEQSNSGVTVTCETLGQRLQVAADYAIVTLPFPTLRFVDLGNAVSQAKRRAVRQLHYDTASKVFLQFSGRFWETEDGIFGGASLTDLPIRKVYYPRSEGDNQRGVLLASFTWGDDARSWGALPEGERLELALRYLTRIHPQAGALAEGGACKCWHADRYAAGAFALHYPGQHTLLQEATARPEGRIHFAGEHTSLSHGWIEGAVSSALRAVSQIHFAAGR